MKICKRCRIEKNEFEYKTKRTRVCTPCKKVQDVEKSMRYFQTEKGKRNKKKNGSKYRSNNREMLVERHREYYKTKRSEVVKDYIETLSDEYIIMHLQNAHLKTRYTREYLIKHPEIIISVRKKIVANRIKKILKQIDKNEF